MNPSLIQESIKLFRFIIPQLVDHRNDSCLSCAVCSGGMKIDGFINEPCKIKCTLNGN